MLVQAGVRDYCDEHHQRLTVMIFYPMEAVDGGLTGWWTKSAVTGGLVSTHCRNAGIPVIDLMNFIHGKKCRQQLFFATDKHPNARGNREIARILFQQAIAEQMIQSSSSSTKPTP